MKDGTFNQGHNIRKYRYGVTKNYHDSLFIKIKESDKQSAYDFTNKGRGSRSNSLV